MKHIRLYEYEEFRNTSEWSKDFMVQTFIEDWTAGESTSLNILTPGVINAMQSRLDKDKYVLYRGMKESGKHGFPTGLNWDRTKEGNTKHALFNSPTSWTTQLDIAINFSNPTYNEFTHRSYPERYMEKQGFAMGDLLGYGMVVKATFEKSDVYCDMSKFKEYLTRSFINKEHEFIIAPGSYDVRVMEMEIYAMDYPDHIYDEKVAKKLNLEVFK